MTRLKIRQKNKKAAFCIIYIFKFILSLKKINIQSSFVHKQCAFYMPAFCIIIYSKLTVEISVSARVLLHCVVDDILN